MNFKPQKDWTPEALEILQQARDLLSEQADFMMSDNLVEEAEHVMATYHKLADIIGYPDEE